MVMMLCHTPVVHNRPMISRPRIHSARRSKIFRVKAESVVPEVMHIITEYVCPIAKNCTHMYIGDEQHQLDVLNQIVNIMDKFDINHGEGYVLRALFQDNKQLAIQIAKAFNNYNLGIEIVRETIQKLPDIANVANI